MSKLIQIRKEFGEPFTEVVRGFAAMGYSRRATAQAIGIGWGHFHRTLSRFDLHRHFLPRTEQNRAWGGGKGTPRMANRKPIIHQGVTYRAGEPMHHYLWNRRNNEPS